MLIPSIAADTLLIPEALVTITESVYTLDRHPPLSSVRVTTLVPVLVQSTTCGPAPVPGDAVPPAKSHEYVVPAGAVPVNTTDTLLPVPTACRLSVNDATGVGVTDTFAIE